MQGLFVSGGQNGCVSVAAETASDTRFNGTEVLLCVPLVLKHVGGSYADPVSLFAFWSGLEARYYEFLFPLHHHAWVQHGRAVFVQF